MHIRRGSAGINAPWLLALIVVTVHCSASEDVDNPSRDAGPSMTEHQPGAPDGGRNDSGDNVATDAPAVVDVQNVDAAAPLDVGNLVVDGAAASEVGRADASACSVDAAVSTVGGGSSCARPPGPSDAGAAADAPASPSACRGGAFVHPGALHTQAQLDRIKAAIAARTEPYASAWAAFHPPGTDSRANPPTHIDAATNAYALQDQGHTMYLLAVYWALSGDKATGKRPPI